MKIYGTEVIKRKGETLNKVIERTKAEIYAEQQKQPVFVKVPAKSIIPKVVGMPYVPTLGSVR